MDNSYPNFITVLERAERLEVAANALNAAPDDPAALVAMGSAVMGGEHLVDDGRQRRAIGFFRKAIEIRPGFAQAHYGICKAYVQIANSPTTQNPELDAELAILLKLAPKLGAEIDQYRKTYQGGITVFSSSTKPR